MKKMIIKHSLLTGVAVLSIALALPVVANAQNAHAQDAQQSAEERQNTVQQTAKDRKGAAQTKLADAKLKACQNRQKAITNIMTRLADRGQKQTDLFGTIADKTKSFYTTKGNILANYDVLVADVTAKKAAAQSAVSVIVSSSTTFDCSGDNPKGMVNSFKNSLKSEIEALKAYKTSVKNLIVGVKSVQGTTSSDNGGQQ